MERSYGEKTDQAAVVFTPNVVKAAPVIWDKEVVEHSPFVQAVVVNAGIANAGTGPLGYENCKITATSVAQELNIPPNAVLVASTGVIGMQLPVERLVAGAKLAATQLKDNTGAGDLAATAIMTTDTVSKQVAVTIAIDGKPVTIRGMCKGSGMIHPTMGTMLGFITTDAVR